MKKGGTLTRTITGIALLVFLVPSVWIGPVTRLCFFYTVIWFAAREMSDALNRMGFVTSPWIARALALAMCVLFAVKDDTAFYLSTAGIIVMLGLLAALFKKISMRDALGSCIVCFYPTLFLLGYCYLSVQHDTLFWPVLLITLFAAAGCDVFAYFCGRAFGRHKLCPSISPHKTVEGSIFGTVLGTGLGMVAWVILKDFAPIPWYVYLIVSFFCTIAGQLGDLCASMIKRQAGIKDFSDLLPGHGGIIDRIDSFCFAMPVAFFALSLFHAI
jgi:CDP-diglyceride synthetase